MKTIEFVKTDKPRLSEVYAQEHNLVWHGQTLEGTLLMSEMLKREDISFEWSALPFELSPELLALQHSFLDYLDCQMPKKRFSNEPTVRLRSVERLTNGKWQMALQPATYFQYLATNWAAAESYGFKTENDGIISFRDILEPGPLLSPLLQAKASNHIGVGCVLICEDQIVLNVRSKQLATNAGMLGLSASGVLTSHGSQTSPFFHILTELEEELGLGNDEIDQASLRLIGIAREFDRVGKPEMYFIVRSSHSVDHINSLLNLRRGVDAWESTEHVWVSCRNGSVNIPDGYMLQPSARIGLYLFESYLRRGILTL